MKEYTAPQAKVVNFENDYVAAAPGDGSGGWPDGGSGGSHSWGGGPNYGGGNCGGHWG